MFKPMKVQSALFLFLFLASCTSREELEDTPLEVTIEELLPYELQPEDKIQVDFVQYLKETNEYALPLKWKEGADVRYWYDSIAYKLDKTIYSNEVDYSRAEIPKAQISKYFDVKELTTVNFYDQVNVFCGEGEFQRYEFIDQNVDAMPVAVYKVKNKDALYAVAGLTTVLPELGYGVTSTKRIKELAKQKLPSNYEEDRSLLVSFQEVQFYAIQGYERNGFKTYSRIFIENNGKVKQAHTNAESWYYCHMVALPIYQNNYPLLLMEYCKSETDWFETGALIFKDGKYVNY